VGKEDSNPNEQRLRSRIALAWHYFDEVGDFEAYVSMWSAGERRSFRESEEDWQKTLREWTEWHQGGIKHELIEVTITGSTARAKMRVSMQGPLKFRIADILYDYWVFENGDWYLNDAGRTK
jgi:hypothetical protein